MNALLFRTRVAVLWLAVALAASASLLLYVFTPGAVEELVAGEMEGETLTDGLTFFLAVVGSIPAAMAVVAVLVSDRVNPWVNLIVGLVYGLFGGFAVVGHIVDGSFNVHVSMMAVAGAGAFLIAGLSLAGLRRPTSEAAAPASEQTRPGERASV